MSEMAQLVLRYGTALTAVSLALLLDLSLPTLQSDPFLLFVAAVTITAWLGGRGPGLLADALASAVLLCCVPSATLGAVDPGRFLRVGFFSLVAGLIGFLGVSRKPKADTLHKRQRVRPGGIPSSMTEAAWHEQGKLVRLLLESTAEGIYGLDPQGLCTFCNPAGLRLLGYADAQAFLGQPLHHLIHHTRTDGSPYPFEECRIMQALRGGEGVHVEDEVLWRADGTCFPAEYWSYPMRRDSEVIGAVVTFVDRSERQRAEQELRASEERFRQLAENIEGVIWLADLRLAELIYVSPSYEKIWGRSTASLYADPRSFVEAIHPEDRERVSKAMLGEHIEETVREDFRIVHPDGSIRWVNVRGFPIRDAQGQVYRLAGITVDITARKQVEVRLAYQAQLLDEVNDAIIAADQELRITAWNRAAERMYGWRAEEALGQDIRRLVRVQLAHTSREQVLREVLEKGTWRGEAIHWSREGRQMIVGWSIAVIRGMVGEITGTVAINRDITELKESQRLAVQAERLAAIGQVVASLAHESGSALQGMRACLERLAFRLPEQPAALDLVNRALKEQDRLDRLYEDVRLYAAPIRLEPRECRLVEIWRTAWEELAERRAGRQAELVEEMREEDCGCIGDRFRLEQVFRNVFENSLAACADPVRIDIRCSATEIDGRPAVRLAIMDNGPGLNAEQRQKIFEPFYTTKPQGTGLGMAISKRLVEAHGGQIAVGDAADRGATIIITLLQRGS